MTAHRSARRWADSFRFRLRQRRALRISMRWTDGVEPAGYTHVTYPLSDGVALFSTSREREWLRRVPLIPVE